MENSIINFFDNKENTAIISQSANTFFSLPISQLITESDYKIAFNTYKTATEKSEYKIAKIVERIYTEKVNGEKPFDDYIEKVFGVKKSQAYNYIKACKLIDIDGNYSLLSGEKVVKDYSITALVKLVETGKTVNELVQLHKNGDISPDMSIIKLVAVFRKKKDDISADTKVTVNESTAENTESTEKAESTEKTEKAPLSIAKVFENITKMLNENGYTLNDLLTYYETISK